MSKLTNDELFSTLLNLGLGPRRSGTGWQCRCPVHEDRMPSLSASVTPEGRLLLYCHAGCPFVAVLGALGLQPGRVAPALRAPVVVVLSREVEPEPEFTAEWDRLRLARDTDSNGSVSARERTLGIPDGGLRRLGVVWAASVAALAAPMLSAVNGPTIGVRLRADDGRKWAVKGSHNGLFMPDSFTGSGPLYCPEGLTDTAALCGLGVDAIGRPSATGGRALVRAAAKMTGRPVVVVADADAPGRDGAAILVNELRTEGLAAKVMMPPPGCKDIREAVAAGLSAPALAYMERHT